MQFSYLGEVCVSYGVKELLPAHCSTVDRASVETLATRGSNYPFEYELPCIYSHLISSTGGVPDAVGRLEGECIFCYP